MVASPTLSNRKIVIVRSDDFMVQSAYGTPIDEADLDFWQPQTTPSGHSIIPFREETRDCSGENIIIEQITGKIARFTITFNATAKGLAGYFAYLQGVSAAPTGTPANEVQTLDLNGATAGTFRLNQDFEGLVSLSPAIAFDAANGAIEDAIEAMEGVGKGNVTVAGTDPKTITFVNDRAAANFPTMTVTDSTTGGSGVTVTATTDGAANVHEITRTDGENPVLISLIEGFVDDDEGFAKRYQDLAVNDWTVNAPRRGIVTLTIVAFGDPTPELLSGYTFPDCVTEAPLKTRDVRVKVGSDWIAEDLTELTYTESNNIDVSEDALKFAGITPAQLERGDRTASVNMLAKGLPTSDLYEFAEDEDAAFAALEIHLGPPGERLTVYAPNTQFRLDDNLIEFVGAKNKAAFRLLGRPSPDDNGIVTRGTYSSGTFAGTFLATS